VRVMNALRLSVVASEIGHGRLLMMLGGAF
jgi:hypothetical protein